MAQVTSEFQFIGPLGNLSVYKMRGVDKLIVRKKGGASKEKIKTSPRFDRTRRNNAEFSGRACASKWIMCMLRPQKALADYNIAGPLNALMRAIQKLDTVSELGKRTIELSKNPRLLEGFSLNRATPFDSMLRASLSYTISKENLTASVDIPALEPGINFFAQKRNPMYSVVVVLGIVPDLSYAGDNKYEPAARGYEAYFSETVVSDWYTVASGSPATTLSVNLDAIPPDKAHSVMLTIGIRFGTMINPDTVQQVRYAGSAKVLAMA